MEDYKEKYEKSLERAKGAHNSAKLDKENGVTDKITEYTIQLTETIFPELKESEDVKIRKEIIDYLKSFIPHHYDDLVAKSKVWIAWLEKQGEQSNKVSIWKHWKDGIAGNGEGKQIYLVKNGTNYNISSCLGFECDYIELSELDSLMLEKQDEQNTASITDEWIEDYWQHEKVNNPYSYDKGDEIQFDHESFVRFCKKYCKKPTDKIEPKFKVGDRIYDKRDSYNRNIIREVGKDYYINAFGQKMDMTYTNANFEFIEHLEDDHIDSKPAAWSEEDEKMFNSALWHIKNSCSNGRITSGEGEVYHWLKSLKERYTWKPSEKQIKQLGWIAEQNKDNMIGKELMSLYNDLKKLREE